MKRYEVITYEWSYDGKFYPFKKGDTYEYRIVDTHSNNQVVVEFPVKVSKRKGYNGDYHGVYINDDRMLKNMAHRVCNQMNRESGY